MNSFLPYRIKFVKHYIYTQYFYLLNIHNKVITYKNQKNQLSIKHQMILAFYFLILCM